MLNRQLGECVKQIQTTYGEIALSLGDHIVFLKNNYDLDIHNGDFGTIKQIRESIIVAQQGKKIISFNTKNYRVQLYGYAVIIHKSQGATFDRIFAFLDSFGWDRHLSYVAMIRHKVALRRYSLIKITTEPYKVKQQLSRALIGVMLLIIRSVLLKDAVFTLIKHSDTH